MSPRRIRSALQLGAAGLALATAACTDYRERRETIFPGAGDAVAANRAINTLDPWSPASRRTRLTHDGARMAKAIERYREGPTPPGAGAASTTLTIAPAAPPPAP